MDAMSDPAAEAVNRAYESSDDYLRDGPMLAAAREALKPIRELHRPVSVRDEEVCGECSNMATQIDWPCRTARLVYPEGELS